MRYAAVNEYRRASNAERDAQRAHVENVDGQHDELETRDECLACNRAQGAESAVELCNCESSYCAHYPSCGKPADGPRMMYVGRICKACEAIARGHGGERYLEANGGHTPECEGSCVPGCPIGDARRAEANRRAAESQRRWIAAGAR